MLDKLLVSSFHQSIVSKTTYLFMDFFQSTLETSISCYIWSNNRHSRAALADWYSSILGAGRDVARTLGSLCEFVYRALQIDQRSVQLGYDTRNVFVEVGLDSRLDAVEIS